MFNFRETVIFPPKYTNTEQKYNNINKNHLKFSTKEEKLYVQVYLDPDLQTEYTLYCECTYYIYTLAKDVEGGGGDGIL